MGNIAGDRLPSRRSFVGFGAALLAGGCSHWPGMRNDQAQRPAVAQDRVATAPELVTYLNNNARLVQAIQCNNVAMDCVQGRQPIGLDGKLVCQKPHNFRLTANLLGQPTVDIGSNENEFWYWISKVEPTPYVFHCSYAELARGNVRMALPFQPDMVVAALGIQEYDPNKNYEIKTTNKTYELIETTTSPQGQPIRKITIFDRHIATGSKPQVVGQVVTDMQGKELCSATTYEVQKDQRTGAILPFKVRLTYPSEKVEITLRMHDLQSVTLGMDRVAMLFTRRNLTSLPSYDLARGQPDGPNQNIRPAGGIMP